MNDTQPLPEICVLCSNDTLFSRGDIFERIEIRFKWVATRKRTHVKNVCVQQAIITFRIVPVLCDVWTITYDLVYMRSFSHIDRQLVDVLSRSHCNNLVVAVKEG